MRTSSTRRTSKLSLLSWRGWLTVSVAASVASPVRAQAVTPDSTIAKDPVVAVSLVRGILNSRKEIEAQAAAAEASAISEDSSKAAREEARENAALLRERLAEGDFRVGDRLVIEIQADTAVADTFVVRAGRMLALPGIPEVALRGVLRSEVDSFLTAQYARYVKQPSVKVSALVRLAVLGGVLKQGFYAVPSDLLVSDVIMVAGGPSGKADLEKTVILRGSDVLVKAPRVRTALRDGLTIDQLDIRSGDEIMIGEKKPGSWESKLRIGALILGLAVSIYGTTRIVGR